MNNWLNSIDYFRIFLILLMVAYHAFAPFSGAWNEILGTEQSFHFFYVIDRFFYFGMLESFVFISGYLYRVRQKTKQQAFSLLLSSKIKRLLIPTWIWGILYSLLFFDNFSFCNVLYGIGHLWFLPMLFFCFVLQKLFIERLQNSITRIIVLFIFLFIPLPELPFHINNSFYYLFFFNLGIYTVNSGFPPKINIYILAILFIVSLSINIYVVGIIVNQPSDIISQKILKSIEHSLTRGITSTISVFFYFKLSSFIEISSNFQHIIKKLAELSMGVYLFQEFVLRYLYYRTNFCQVFDLFYPFVGFFLAIIISTFASYLLNNNRSKYLFR